MSVAVLQTPIFRSNDCGGWPAPEERRETRDGNGQLDIWAAVQGQKAAAGDAPMPHYVHPMMRRSSSALGLMSLQMCTESLGSETGSIDFSLFDHDLDRGSAVELEAEQEDAGIECCGDDKVEEREWPRRRARKLTSVNYNCSVGRRSPPRAFPPPLPSISRRDGPCLHMRPHRRDGRLVVEAVAVPSRNYLQAQRQGGRLLLSFVYATSAAAATIKDPSSGDVASTEAVKVEKPEEEVSKESNQVEENEAVDEAQMEAEDKNCDEEEEEEEEEEDEEEEEEVEVVNRGTVVEVKVSTQPQQQTGGMKVLRSSLVINKFVGGTPADVAGNANSQLQASATSSALIQRRPTTATAAVAVALAASTLVPDGDDGRHPALDSKLLFTAKRRNRDEMLHSMWGCNRLRRPWFIWEPCCIATST